MREVAYKELTVDGFGSYGAYSRLIEPSGTFIGFDPIKFYRDKLQFSFPGLTQPSIGVTRVSRRDFVIDTSEYHSSTCEVQIPLDGDMLFHVGHATADNVFPADAVEVFRVPRGTAIVIRPGVWHHAPFALATEHVHCVVILPERTYFNDQFLTELGAEQKLRIRGKGTD